MNGKEMKATLSHLDTLLEHTITEFRQAASACEFGDDERISAMIKAIVDTLPGLDEQNRKRATTAAQKLHALYGQADKLSFALNAQAAGLEKLRRQIKEA